ncbi:MAG: phospholipid carrier-dependent glycosyltransferase [bacterium]|nr:phospholipid carrier-dependent glycosyltransferase [bacterium]
MRDYFLATGLVLTAFLIRIPFLSYPPQTVFDEIHFTNFGLQTLKGETNIDIHPPFIRLVFAGIIKASSFRDLGRKIITGEDYEDFPYVPLRLATVIIGSLLAGVIYLLARKLYADPLLALLPGIFVVFDGALVSYSRTVLYDTYILFFGFLGILLLWLALDGKTKKQAVSFFVLAGIAMGLTASIKWSGLAFLASGFLLLFAKGKIKHCFFLTLIAFLTYFGVFLALYGAGNTGHFYEIQQKMFLGHISVPAHHPGQSPPWQWPLGLGNFIMWGNGTDDIIKLSPNIFSWVAVFVSVLLSLFLFIRGRSGTLLFILGSYFANYLPFFLISRPLFFYHYFPALVFGYLLVPLVFKFMSELLFGQIHKKHIYAVMALNILFFAFFIPFIY